MLLIVTCTRYSLVKGERIVRFVLTTQLRASNRRTSPSLCSQPLPGVLLRLAVWYYSPRTGSAATAPHASIFGRETYWLGLGPHLLVWGPKFTRAAPGVGPNRTCINSAGRLLTSVAQYLRGAREDSRACVPCVVCRVSCATLRTKLCGNDGIAMCVKIMDVLRARGSLVL